MKRLRIVLYSLCLLAGNVGICQTYHAFPDSNAIWNTVGKNFLSCRKYEIRFGINGDTLIGSNLYSKVYRLYDTLASSPESEYFGAIREDADKKVYLDLPEWPEQLLYDFGAEAGDTICYLLGGYLMAGEIYFQQDVNQMIVLSIDSVLLYNNEYRKRWNLDGTDNYWVEGIGSTTWVGLIDPFISISITNGDWYSFTCFKQNDEVVFLENELCPGDCFCSPDASGEPEQGQSPDENISVIVNHSTGEIEIKVLDDGLPLDLIMVNQNGGIVFQESIQENSRNISCSQLGLPYGMYIIILRNNEMGIINSKKFLFHRN